MNIDGLAELGPGGGKGSAVTPVVGLATGSWGSADRVGPASTGYCGRASGRAVGV
jgi:hypothetical protein